jgi:predicted transposase/invertase (TIGR01784 family)
MTNKIRSKKLASKKVQKKANPKASHDNFFKRVMGNPLTACELLEEYWPEEFKNAVDLSTLKVEKESYVEPSLKHRLSDLVYSVKTKDDNKAFIYCLLESQSSVDYSMAFRLWQYSLLLLERHIEKKKQPKLPVIFPFVIYHGKGKYNASLNLWELFDNPELAKKAMSGDYQLLNLQAMSDDDINYEKHLSFVLHVLKHIHDRDLLKMLKDAMERCVQAILIDQGKDYIHIKSILWYLDSKLSEEKKTDLEQLIVDNLPTEDTDKVMRTIAQAYIDQGIEKGRLEAIQNTAIKMLQQKADLKFISAVTGLSRDEILKLQSKTQMAS